MVKREFSLTDNRFGALGWKIIVVVSLAFFFSTGITSDGLNVSVPAPHRFRYQVHNVRPGNELVQKAFWDGQKTSSFRFILQGGSPP